MTNTQHSLETMWKLRSLKLVRDLKLLSNTQHPVSIPLVRYIMASYWTLPVKTVVLVERPYRNNIHPEVSSAMSYDISKSRCPTPSTTVMASDLYNQTGMDWDKAENWFRHSWQYISSGVFLMNVCCFEEFMSNSLNERVAVQSFIRDMISVSYDMSKIKVELVALGNPAIDSSNKIRANMSDRKYKVRVHRGPNPAGLRHRFGDLRSPDVTLGSKQLSTALANAITRSESVDLKFVSDYISMSTPTRQMNKSKITSAQNNLDSDLERAEKFFKSGGKYDASTTDDELFASLRKSLKKFTDVLVEERVTVMLAGLEENNNSAKGAYTSSNRRYEQKQWSKGSSSEVSGTPKTKFTPSTTKMKFADDDDSPSAPESVQSKPTASTSSEVPIMTPSTPQPSTPVQRGSSSKRSVSAYTSANSAQSTKLGFVDEDDEDVLGEIEKLEVSTPTKAQGARAPTPVTMNDEEATSMSYVADVLHTSADFNVDPSVVEEVSESVSSKRASTASSKEVLKVIRSMAENGDTDIASKLGFTTGKADINSPIMKLLLSWGT